MIAKGFPAFNIKTDTVAAWDLFLSDQTPEALLAGALAYVRAARYPTPTVGDWLDHARKCDLSRAQRLTAAEAWDEMYRNRHARHRGPVKWSSEAVLRAARAVRWDDPEWLTEQMPTIRAQFERYFNALADKTERVDEAVTVRQIADGRPAAQRLYGPNYTDDAP